MSLTVVIVGAGAAATTFATALRLAHVPVLAVWARRAEAATAAGQASGVAARWGAPPPELALADVVLVAVRDAAISEVATQLAQVVSPRSVVLHTSGAHAAGAVLAPLVGRAHGVGTLHPLAALTLPPRPLAGVTFGVEGDAAGQGAARALAAALGGHVLALPPGAMPLYHAAAVLASNALVGLVDAATTALAALGVPLAEAQQALAPLAAGALAAATDRPLPDALTGPIARGDATTVAGHLAALRERAPQLVPLYVAAARQILALAERRTPPPPRDGLARIAELLAATTR